MSLSALESTVNTAFDARDGISTSTKGEVREAVDHALELMDKGEARVAVREANGKWKVHQWLKKAVLLSFRLNDMSTIPGGPGKASWWDKVPSKFEGWGENRFRDAGFRAVPGAIVRRSAFIAKNVVLMPSFVNLGAYVDEATMIDTWSTVGSCAQIGKRVHISGGVGIGRELNEKQWRAVIRQLIAMGHLRADSEAYGALKLTDTARGVLKGETGVMLREQAPGTRIRATREKSRRGNLAPAANAPQGDVDPELRTRLRAWRSNIARERGVPAYVVLHDATIDGIVRAWPTTLDELRGVPGIGDKKLEHYGEELLRLVRERRD